MALDPRSGRPEPGRTLSRTWPALTIVRADPPPSQGFDEVPPGRAACTEADNQPDDLVQAVLIDFDVAAIEELPDGLRVYFGSADARDAAALHLRLTFPDLTLTAMDVPDDDWAARSQASLRAVHVGNLIVAPPWDARCVASAPDSGMTPPVQILIQPSMGFGTGHHATTRLCLAALQAIPLTGRSVIDVGTGSGVLAIAASLLGVTDVMGIDDDADAIRAAEENVTLNPSARVALRLLDLRAVTLPAADVVTANLTGALLASAASGLLRLTRPGGWLVISGFMKDEEADVVRAFGGCITERRASEDEWVCTTLRRAAVL